MLGQNIDVYISKCSAYGIANNNIKDFDAAGVVAIPSNYSGILTFYMLNNVYLEIYKNLSNLGLKASAFNGSVCFN